MLKSEDLNFQVNFNKQISIGKILFYKIGFFGSNRKDKKDKKNDKKISTKTKSTKTSQVQQTRVESPLPNTNNETNDFNLLTDNGDDFTQISLNKSVTINLIFFIFLLIFFIANSGHIWSIKSFNINK